MGIETVGQVGHQHETRSDFLNRVVAAHVRVQARKGRNAEAGNLRGWGLQFSDLVSELQQQPEFRRAEALSAGRTLLPLNKLANLYLILKYGLASVPGDIVEFGSYRGGSALFMAEVLRSTGSKKKVFACDTYAGMPPTDSSIDLHSAGDFGDASVDEINAVREAAGLKDHLVLVKGLFEHTLPDIRQNRTFALAHVDCDIYRPIIYVLDEVDRYLSPGAYVVFDDPLFGSCLGAMEACEEVYLHRKKLHAEQAYPHLVYRPAGV